MRCDEVRPRLDAYIDGELVEGERTLLREHLADCPECGPEAAALTRLRDGIRQAAPLYRAPAALHSRIHAALRAEAATSARAARPAPAPPPATAIPGLSGIRALPASGGCPPPPPPNSASSSASSARRRAVDHGQSRARYSQWRNPSG